jgi:hypothetical protein
MKNNTIDTLHQAFLQSTQGKWKLVQSARPCIETNEGADVVDTSSSGMEGGGFVRDADAQAVVDLHNAWPAVHQVLLMAATVCRGEAVVSELRQAVEQLLRHKIER